jgi:hypothetical protein
MLFYFDFDTYRRMFRLARREENAANRRKLLFILLVLLPLVSTVHAVFFFLDYVFYPGLREVDVHAPVFIVGHARSGTTLMHRLMSRDTERFSFFLLYEMFFPSLIEKKLLRFVAECDRRYLGGAIENRIDAWEARKFAKTQDMHATGLTAPEEDDFIHTFSCASGFWIVLFPYMGELDFYYVDERPPKRRRRLMGFYKECVKRQLYLNGAEKSHLSKNPTFSGRIESLIEAFPGARIVVLMRNPYETVPSLLKLMKRSWQLRRWNDAQMSRSLRVLADQSFHTYRYPLEVLARHPETRHAVGRLSRARRPAEARRRAGVRAARISGLGGVRGGARGRAEPGEAARDDASLQPRRVRAEGRRDPCGARGSVRELRLGRRRRAARSDGRRRACRPSVTSERSASSERDRRCAREGRAASGVG